MQVLFWDAVAVRGAGVQLLACCLLSGVYAGVFFFGGGAGDGRRRVFARGNSCSGAVLGFSLGCWLRALWAVLLEVLGFNRVSLSGAYAGAIVNLCSCSIFIFFN